MMLKFMETKSNEHRLTQKQICIQLRFPDSTLKRYRDDIQMDSPYNRIKYRKKNNKSNTTLTEIYKPHEKSKNK